ncbi:piggyBac transposable element-derived protein 4-like [Chanodichthys erythropterus]|uniref:piggyBac transposable element-derived protein 4-like n=1 Tax=Chanodichthys erythropterus TaxID=933992 RepID=UPI00351ED328
MARYSDKEALQMILDSEEEFTFSSEEDCNSDDEQLHFQQRIDPDEDIISENVAASRSPSPAPRRGARRSRSVLSAIENHTDNVAASQSPSPAPRRGARRSRSVLSAIENHTECDNENIQEPVPKRQSTLSWKTQTDVDMVPHTLRFLPARETGPQLNSAESHSPMNLFKLFFSESAVSTLCHNTNAQAAKATAKGCKYKWTDVSIGEMYRYIGLVFYMAMVKMSSISDYWRQSSVFSVPFPATLMPRDRYRTISWNVHMSHPDEDKVNDRKRGTAEHDRLFRIKPLMDTIRQACKAIYHPRKNLAVDERMVACKAHTGMTQYMKAKPTKWGFKLFVLADSSNGYTLDFSVYTGKNNFPTGHGLSYDAVTSLLDRTLLGSGYHVYMDNFYTSPKLLKDLFAMKFGACGTYRDNRKDCPRNAANSLSKKSARGSIRWIRDGPLVFVKWMDTREVSVCSTIHSAHSGDCAEEGEITRNMEDKDISMSCTCDCIQQTHLSDQLIQYYTTQHKTMKWYRKIFLHFLDIAATNSFILHKELHGSTTAAAVCLVAWRVRSVVGCNSVTASGDNAPSLLASQPGRLATEPLFAKHHQSGLLPKCEVVCSSLDGKTRAFRENASPCVKNLRNGGTNFL